MTTISLIVAVSDNGVIGRRNALPWRLSADLRYFKQRTLGKPVIMGRKTHEAIGRALPGRHNIVVTRNPDSALQDVSVVTSLEAAFAEAGDAEEVMVIGGAEIYTAALPLVRRLYLTRVHLEVPDGDAFFPDPDLSQWRVVCEHFLGGEGDDPDCTFLVYERD